MLRSAWRPGPCHGQGAKHCTQALFFFGVLFTCLTDMLIKYLKVRKT